MRSEPVYEYAATVIANVDGDTIHARVDLGFDIHVDTTLRFAGINAPEKATTAGMVTAAYVARAIPAGFSVTIRTKKDRHEKFGRMLAWVVLADGSCLNRTLVNNNLAVAYGDLPIDPPGGI